MKPFRERFARRFQEEWVRPLERELDLDFDDYSGLLRGQLTFAVTRNGWHGTEDQPPGVILLLDTKDKASQLKTNLAALRQKWMAAAKPLRTEKVLNYDFSVLTLSSNDIPRTFRRFFPPPLEEHDIATEGLPKEIPPPVELVFGQVGSLLVVGNSSRVVEKVVIRATGGAMPSLGELAAYDLCRQALFRGAPLYGWANVKGFVDILTRRQSERTQPEVRDPFSLINPKKLLTATGLNGPESLAFGFRGSPEGLFFQLLMVVPESSRRGVFSLLAAEHKSATPPPFVPADAVKFQRWRVNGRKASAELGRMLAEISPQLSNALNYLLDTANTAAQLRNPGFDLRKSLLANLGDDVISYEKSPRDSSSGGLDSAPSLLLIGSPDAEQLAIALRSLLNLSQPSGVANQREFLGRKIYSVPFPSLPLPISLTGKSGSPPTLSFAGSGGYVALSTQASMLEEYLRSTENPPKPLCEVMGLADATQKVIDPNTGWFGFRNQLEITRALVEGLKSDPPDLSRVPGWLTLLTSFGLSTAAKNVSEWMDFSLLPDFDQISKYFGFTVYSGSANVEGIGLRVFMPRPDAFRFGISTSER